MSKKNLNYLKFEMSFDTSNKTYMGKIRREGEGGYNLLYSC